MPEPKVSVVMPIYNVENYLEDTLDCLLKQTFIDNMEVLMIDDGSTDNSRYIIEKYALDYENFHAFHKKNEGPAIARNFGIDMAKGDYIHFMDADDNITPEGYERLYEIAADNDSDIVTAPVIRLRRYNIFDGKFYKNSLINFNQDIPSTDFQSNPELIWDLFITNKLYKRDFLNKNNLRNNVGNKAYCDDGPFSLKAYLLADTVSVSTDVFYYWRYRENTVSSTTQTLSHLKTFHDRLDSILLYLNVISDYNLNESLLREFYLKLLNHDLYLHLSKFYTYDEEHHMELAKRVKEILSLIQDEYKQMLNSFKRIIYKMVEEEEIEDLVNFSQLEAELKENPHIPSSLNEKYVKYVDFDRDAADEGLTVKKENITLDNGNLIIEFKKRLNYLNGNTPHETIVKLIDDNNDESILNEDDSKITIPVSLIENRNHMKIKVECIFDSFKKECCMTNYKREIFELDDFDIEIGIGPNYVFFMDIRQTNDLVLEIEDVAFEDNVFKFRGVSNGEISGVFLQNVATFDKIPYAVKSARENGNYEIGFSIPYDDILSFPVRKWELKVDGAFKTIKIDKKFEFYGNYSFIYMMGLRNKILISSDFYNLFEKLYKLKNQVDAAKSKNVRLADRNSKLKDKNSKLSQKNKELNEIIDEYKSRKVVRFMDKIKS